VFIVGHHWKPVPEKHTIGILSHALVQVNHTCGFLAGRGGR